MMASTRTLVIAGGGFSGVAVAVKLLRTESPVPLRIVLIERHLGQLARGPAYAARSFPYLLNVPAGRMSASSSDPLDFLRFAQRRLPGAGVEDFLPRALYGDYLAQRLLEAELTAPPNVRFLRLCDEVLDVNPRIGGGFRVRLTRGGELAADDVVLTTGAPATRALSGTERLRGSPAYVADPWSAPLAFRPGETLLLVGSGLTMIDVASAAAAAGRVRLHALSRHGLMPLPQLSFPSHCTRSHPEVLAACTSASALMGAVRRLVADMQAQGADWREAVTCVRGLSPELWRRLPERERSRFLRHASAYWMVHRHRMPTDSVQIVEAELRAKRLTVHAGRLLELAPDLSGVQVRWQPRAGGPESTLTVDRVVNCTGPDYDLHRTANPLMRALLDSGLLSTDPLHTGLRTTPEHELVGAQGRVQSGLYYVGPLLRAEHWEATAVPELRAHAEQLALHLVRVAGARLAV